MSAPPLSVLLLAVQLASGVPPAPSPPSLPARPDSFVDRVVAEVRPESIRAHIQRLQDFRTRYSYTDSCRAAEQWVAGYYTALGLDSVELDSYPRAGGYWRNPVGTRLGGARPEKILVVCGHMDAISEDPYDLAPGAEDNGSGTAVAIEAARVLADEAIDLTVRFVNFTGEEQGLYGSTHYAERMRNEGADIIGVLNFDMVAWPGGDWGVNLVGLPGAQRQVQLQVRMKELYTALDHRAQVRSFPSDSRPFEEQGYVATSGFEYGHIPYEYYHSTGDTLGNLDMDLAAEVTRMAVATLASLAVAPLPPEAVELRDIGNGTDLRLSWSPGTEPDLAGYKLFWGQETTRYYTDSAAVGQCSSYTITGLLPESLCFATVVAVDSAGHESGWSGEASCTPAGVPVPPAGIRALPFLFGMRLDWRPNRELDLAGYNLYRTTVSGTGYQLLNTGLLTDTVFRDSALAADTTYYYVATAVDTGGNEGGYSVEVRGKPISLDHGILLVDETRDGNGNPGSPSDEQQDAFYHMLLHGYRYTDWDVATSGVPLAGDFGPYSTVLWHGDEYGLHQAGPALPGLANYLEHGGGLWFTGWKPFAALMGAASYPFVVGSGEFPHDYFGVDGCRQSPIPDFIGADGAAGYPDVGIDSTKTLGALHGRLPYVDVPLPGPADTVLRFVSATGDSFDGMPVGVRWLNGTWRALLCGFPLYYALDTDARQLARQVLEEFGEEYGVAEPERAPAAVRFYSATPSPFRRTARLEFGLVRAGRVRLAAYSSAGRLVEVLVDEVLSSGRHAAAWDARGLPSGVYFLRLWTGGTTASRKIELAR